MHKLANPARFLRISRAIMPWCFFVTVTSMVVGLYWGLFIAPEDYQMGSAYRIIFVHVPSSYMSIFCYGFMAVASAVGIIWKHPLADQSARAAAPIGAIFTVLALFTGSLWGKPMWGTYWIWDARLTSELVLLFLYFGYMAVWGAIDDRAKAARVAAIVALVGAVNLPIIKFSVDWWNTLHQPASIMKSGGASIHPDMLWPLLICIVAFNFYFVTVLLLRIESQIINRQIRGLQIRMVEERDDG
ncbi:MAG: heme ABC transporter permease [Emcibacteraceae bacterium]|nr:heme ABC transporter permease [Emcibacteraceae bacterium]